MEKKAAGYGRRGFGLYRENAQPGNPCDQRKTFKQLFLNNYLWQPCISGLGR
jgi:hypothetical protein